MEKLSYEEKIKGLTNTILATRRMRRDLIKVFKVIKGIDDLPLYYLFSVENMKTVTMQLSTCC